MHLLIKINGLLAPNLDVFPLRSNGQVHAWSIASITLGEIVTSRRPTAFAPDYPRADTRDGVGNGGAGRDCRELHNDVAGAGWRMRWIVHFYPRWPIRKLLSPNFAHKHHGAIRRRALKFESALRSRIYVSPQLSVLAKNAYHIIFDSAVFHEERLIDRKTNAPWRSTASRSTSRSRSPTRPQLLIPKSKACQSTPEEISARSTKPFLQEGPLTSNDTERQAIKDAGTISDFN
ncbi:hypothetical protein EXIGLDRAFT_702728, partial [Exidia glandulosa HHB12029]